MAVETVGPASERPARLAKHNRVDIQAFALVLGPLDEGLRGESVENRHRGRNEPRRSCRCPSSPACRPRTGASAHRNFILVLYLPIRNSVGAHLWASPLLHSTLWCA